MLANRGCVPSRVHPPGRGDAAPVVGPGHRPHRPRPAGTLQLRRRDRTRAAAGPAPAAAPNRLAWNPAHPRSRMPPSLVQTTLRTGESPCARSRPLPTCQHRRRCSRNASGLHCTARPLPRAVSPPSASRPAGTTDTCSGSCQISMRLPCPKDTLFRFILAPVAHSGFGRPGPRSVLGTSSTKLGSSQSASQPKPPGVRDRKRP